MTAETEEMIAEMVAEMADVAIVTAAEEAIETAETVTVEIAEVATGAGTPRLGKAGTSIEATARNAAETVTELTVTETSPVHAVHVLATQEERIPSQDLPVRVRSATAT